MVVGQPVSIAGRSGEVLVMTDIHETTKHYREYGQQDKATRQKYYTGDILENAAECLKCNTYIRSNNVHDYRTCFCGAVAVDGGSQYIRRSGNPEDYRDIIILYDDVKDVKLI